jgi:hypothetical protein
MNDTLTVICPEHLLEDHQAVLYRNGHKYAGIWECLATGVSDACEHDNTHTEEIEVDTTRNGEHDTYLTKIEICNACEVTV